MAMTDLRARLHRVPEQAGLEVETAKAIREFLAAASLEPAAENVGGHGLLYVLGDRASPGPHRLWRAELDALAEGHRCGHDGHMAMLAGAVARLPDGIPAGSLTILFQPAEETGEGMARCLEHPLLAGPFDEAISFHNVPGRPLGQVILGPGALASEGVRMRFKGREAHAADPDAEGDVWPAMQEAIATVKALHPETGCATLIHVRLGDEAYGTRPGDGIVAATLRGAQEEVDGMRSTLAALAPVERVDPFPATRNDPTVVERVRAAAEEVGLDVTHRNTPFTWSEDFGHALDRWPGALIGIGSGAHQPALHDDDYEFPDALLDIGVRLWLALVA